MKRSILVAAVSALLIAGCGVPEKDVEYESINDLATAYEDALGGDTDCTRRDSSDLQDFGWEYTNCKPSGTIMMFTSDDQREEVLKTNPLGSGDRWVQGPNWVIRAPQYDAEAAQEALGGTLRG